jgi:SAM-dependent methyltransferase
MRSRSARAMPHTRRMSAIGDRWFAWTLSHVSGAYDRLLADRKRRLLGGLRGTVVEIGPGTGANLRYYAPEVRWIGIEPNAVLRRQLREQRADARAGWAESLGLESASVDAVVSTAVLCSVRDVDRSLAEARRVLRPGGRFVFIEHVAADGALGLVQRGIRPLWSCCGGGCNPARDTAAAVLRAFPDVEMERFRLPLGPVGPHISGVGRSR